MIAYGWKPGFTGDYCANATRNPIARLGQNHLPAAPREPDIRFDIAEHYRQVESAWSLVYASYLQSGLIHPNSAAVHAVPQAVQDQAVVVSGKVGPTPVYTMSGYMDGAMGLPLDLVYPEQLDAMRDNGRILGEIGLFAQHRNFTSRPVNALFELIRHVTHFILHCGATDGVIGVHPRHVGFYTRLLGFEVAGPEKVYPTVRHNPVVLLRIDWARATAQRALPRGLKYLVDRALGASFFAKRFRFQESALAGTPVERYFDCPVDRAATVPAA